MTTDFIVKTGTTVKNNARWNGIFPVLSAGAYSTSTYIFGHAPALSAVFANISDSGTLTSMDSVLYTWDFGDYYNQSTNTAYTTSINDVVSHIYMMPGTYNVTLTQNKNSTIQTTTTVTNTSVNTNNCFGKYCQYWYWGNLQSSSINFLTWKDASTQGSKTATWGNSKIVDSNCNNTVLSGYYISSTTQSTIKTGIVTLDEVLPVAILKTVGNSYGQTPLTVTISPYETLCGSYPLDRIDWNIGDGSGVQTVSRYSAPTSIFTYNGEFPSDVNDPRNYDLTYTYQISSYNVFYPSITAYSMNTDTFDVSNVVVGPLSYPSISSTSVQLLKVRNSKGVITYGFQVGDNISLVKVGVTPFPTIRNSYYNAFPTVTLSTSNGASVYSVDAEDYGNSYDYLHNGGAYANGTLVTIMVFIDSDWYFHGWYDSNNVRVSNLDTYTFTLTDDISLYANVDQHSGGG